MSLAPGAGHRGPREGASRGSGRLRAGGASASLAEAVAEAGGEAPQPRVSGARSGARGPREGASRGSGGEAPGVRSERSERAWRPERGRGPREGASRGSGGEAPGVRNGLGCGALPSAVGAAGGMGTAGAGTAGATARRTGPGSGLRNRPADRRRSAERTGRWSSARIDRRPCLSGAARGRATRPSSARTGSHCRLPRDSMPCSARRRFTGSPTMTGSSRHLRGAAPRRAPRRPVRRRRQSRAPPGPHADADAGRAVLDRIRRLAGVVALRRRARHAGPARGGRLSGDRGVARAGPHVLCRTPRPMPSSSRASRCGTTWRRCRRRRARRSSTR
jgi:hypothetical protein